MLAPDVYLLKLFVTGRTPRSERAVTDVLRICEAQLAGRHRVEVVDVLERPDLAEESGVLATPTLVRELPPPLRRIIGDLTGADRVFAGLDIEPYGSLSGER